MSVGAIQKWTPPPDIEARLASFTDLAATAISNADSRAAVSWLAQEQAALRRVATLVARGAPPEELFQAVTAEAGQLLQADQTTLCRYEPDGTMTVLAGWSSTGNPYRAGLRPPLGGSNLSTIVWKTRRPARLDSYAGASGEIAALISDGGLRPGVATPIIVRDRLWGVIVANSTDDRPLPADTEARLTSFTDLVATAISNADNLAELTASRARVVATADETDGGSSATCTTAPSSGSSRSGSRCGPRRWRSRRSSAGWRQSWRGSPTGSRACRTTCRRWHAASIRRSWPRAASSRR
jgi:hypothetical protein